MHHKNRDLIIIMIIVVLNIIWALLPNRPIIGVILVLPMIFILPGYTLTTILIYKPISQTLTRSLLLKPKLLIDRQFDYSDRFVLSIGLSLSIDVLSGFILNMFSVGLEALSWSVFLGLLISVFTLMAAYLRHKEYIDIKQKTKLHINIYECLLLVLTITVVSLSILYSTVNAMQQTRPGFTQLWLLQSKVSANSCTVILGIRSFELASTKYRVTMFVNGNLENEWVTVTLAPQQEWDKQVALVPKSANTYVEVKIYRVNNLPSIYRDVHLTLHALKGDSDDHRQLCST